MRLDFWLGDELNMPGNRGVGCSARENQYCLIHVFDLKILGDVQTWHFHFEWRELVMKLSDHELHKPVFVPLKDLWHIGMCGGQHDDSVAGSIETHMTAVCLIQRSFDRLDDTRHARPI